MNRFAFVRNAPSRTTVEAYLPSNYAVLGEGSESKHHGWDGVSNAIVRVTTFYVIGGHDSAGWTLDGYVIPRFLSGLIGCEEVSEQKARDVVASSSRPDSYIGLPVVGAPFACVECGHLHYEGKGVWSECPIESCDCAGQ